MSEQSTGFPTPEVAPGAPQQPQSLIERLRKMGFEVAEVTKNDRWMVPALEGTTGVSGWQDIDTYFQSALDGSKKAARNVEDLGIKARTALLEDRGSVRAVPATARVDGNKPTKGVIAGGVDYDGTVFVGFAPYSKRAQKRALQKADHIAPPFTFRRDGITESLIPHAGIFGFANRKARGDTLERIRRTTRLGQIVSRGLEHPQPSSGLDQLDPRFVFTTVAGKNRLERRRFALPGIGLAAMLLDPEQRDLSRVAHIGLLTRDIGRVIGLKPREAADLFAAKPAIWQSLAALTPATNSRHSRRRQRDHARGAAASRLEEIPGNPDLPPMTAIAYRIGTALIADRWGGRQLRRKLSGSLGANLPQPEWMGQLPALPQKPKRGLGQTARAARAQYDREMDEYAMRRRGVLRVDEDRRAELAQHEQMRTRLTRDGARMLAKATRYYMDGKPGIDLQEIIDAAADPSLLPALNARMRRAKSSGGISSTVRLDPQPVTS